ncbi:phage holin family protein [Craterilacuibacter sp.]|uniref:phage holin family protein n=1 Tax=Craterilacuibacter sp. TaxID=2870909 RepID=UPI003F3678A1
MASPRTARPGSLRSMLEALAALFFTRAELMRIEADEQQERLVANIMLLAGALILFFAALISLLLFVMLVLPPSARVLAAGLFTLGFFLTAFSLLLLLKRRMAHAPKAFALTLAEVKKDWHAVSGKEHS